MEPNEVTALIVGNMMSGMLAQQQQLGALHADVAGLRGVESAGGRSAIRWTGGSSADPGASVGCPR
jgi:hypothetical protein